MKIACTNCMVPGESLIEKANKVRAWGFDAMCIQIHEHLRTDEVMDQVFSLKEKTGVDVCEFSFVGGCFSRHMDTDPAVKENAIQYFFDSIDVCKRIGALTAIGYEYRPRDPLPLFDCNNQMSAEDEKEFLRILKLVAKRANEAGVVFALEAINRYETRHINNLADCRDAIDKVRDECQVGIIADSFHLAIEERNMADAIRASKGYISEVHLGENNRQLPGYGAIDWIAFFRALKDISFDGFVTLECGVPGDPEIMLPQCAKFLKDSIAKA
ncbi:MAG: sugar phosphate isomerase/epimerase [Planctomycetes bacterium]|nr:sugar phosphate isomerase/epimerase [Planctomycetota bacterium]